MGLVEWIRGQDAKALELLRKATEADPRLEEGWEWLGRLAYIAEDDPADIGGYLEECRRNLGQ